MGDGIKRGKQTNEALGHLAYWLSKRCPTLPDKLCERFLHAEFPPRNEHRWFTIQRFAVYRGDASAARPRLASERKQFQRLFWGELTAQSPL